jgi:hypothetical protein
MVYRTHYPCYFDPTTHAMLNLYPWHCEPHTHGILNLLRCIAAKLWGNNTLMIPFQNYGSSSQMTPVFRGRLKSKL